jgi:hypothetical protein
MIPKKKIIQKTNNPITVANTFPKNFILIYFYYLLVAKGIKMLHVHKKIEKVNYKSKNVCYFATMKQHQVILSLGSNQGDRLTTIEACI